MIETFRLDVSAYWLLALCFAGLVSVTWHLVQRDRWEPVAQRLARTPARVPVAPEHLTPYELAYLAGGTRRVIHTAIAALVATGALRVSRRAVLSPVAGAPAPAEPIEQALLWALAGSRRGRPAGDVYRAVTAGAAMAALRRGLTERGLRARQPELRWLRFWLRVHLTVSLAALVLPWLLIVLSAPVPSGPSGLAAIGVTLTSVIGALGVRAHARQTRWLREVDSTGHYAVAARRTALRQVPDAAGTAQVPAAVALDGLDGLPDRNVAAALRRYDRRRDRRGGGGGCGAGCGGCG